jgi:diguanylate cyclase (GGDEF)-like protein
VGRWGGDEFIILLDCAMAHAEPQLERVRKWVCGNYVVEGVAGPVKFNVGASVGLAQYTPTESIAQLLDRADAAMYADKRSMAASMGTAATQVAEKHGSATFESSTPSLSG